MATQRRRGSVGAFRRPQRPATNWGRIVPTQVTLVLAGSKVLLATFILTNAGIGETIRRTRGSFLALSDQSAQVESQIGAWGMVVVNDIALGVGAASIPGPVTDADDDGWFVWEPILQVSEADEGAADGAATGFVGQRFDSKAMRRVEEGFGVALMVENSSSAFSMNAMVTVSMLSSRTA